jgi:hypothetical protein
MPIDVDISRFYTWEEKHEMTVARLKTVLNNLTQSTHKENKV